MLKAHLSSAFVFDCELCGAQCFIPAIEGAIDEPAIRAAAGEQVSQHFDCIASVGPEDTVDVPSVIMRVAIAPPVVTCQGCATRFATRLWSNP